MNEYLWTAFIAADGSNRVLVASSQAGQPWTGSRFIEQWSPFTPSLKYFKNRLYAAFVTNDVAISGGSRVPSNRIFLTSTDDGVTWSAATFFNQYSKNSPCLCEWNGSLYIAFIASDPSNRILVCSSADGSNWSGTTDTGQTSPQAPSLAAFNDNLYLAFVSNDSRNAILLCSMAPGGNWGGATNTNQSCRFSPALSGFGDNLYLAFTANNDTQSLLVCSSQNWSADTRVNQSSSHGPSFAVFNNSLNLGFVANDPSRECMLTSSSNPSQWPNPTTDLKKSADSRAALAAAPFSCCSDMAMQPNPFGAGNNYFIWCGSCDPPTYPTDLTLTIEISSDLLSSNGLSFQWNGWSPSGLNLDCKWQQYGFTIDTQGTIVYFVENWPTAAYLKASGNANITNHHVVLTKLPTPTLPAGYILKIQLENDERGYIIATTWSVYNQKTLVAIGQQTLTQGPTNVPAAALAPFMGFETVLVGIDSEVNKGVGLFVSGQGTFTVTSANELLPATPRPPCLEDRGIGTFESGNTTYAQLPACKSNSVVQRFTVNTSS